MGIFSWLARKKPPPLKPFDFSKNRFPAHTRWPPSFTTLSRIEQFHFERKFRRRSKLKWRRPIWNRNLQMLQWFMVLSVLGYGAFFLDWQGEGSEQVMSGPFGTLRNWIQTAAGSIWAASSTQKSREHVEYVQHKLEENEIPKRRSAPPV
ncbi:hypothetical protein BT63DRAFT_414806 [Microthyrium microscopicum]|uniref:Uncharacterized protein n=1 Tax=Microthyrium microscopicum TaxID=703497 RepID=A0A6A6U9C9_9PEZI|nr:hypothetical protein BT63DRAFT_414806 [Microthyrium microscopicum]